MITCTSCGFEMATASAACPLCGESRSRDEVRLDDPTLALPEELRPHVPRVSNTSPKPLVFDGRFIVEAALGQGGMGRVFRVRDKETGAIRALKIIRPDLGESQEVSSRFRREIAILSQLDHPYLPKIYRWGQSQASLYFVSDFFEGSDLKTEIRKRGPWPVNDAVRVVSAIAEALQAAHKAGVIHRDVKSNNVMVLPDGSIRLLDFGLARHSDADYSSLTNTGLILGTPGYMSPEQFEGRGVDARSDIYSLGVVLFEMLTGRLPFLGSTPVLLAVKLKTEPPPPPSALRPGIPSAVEKLALKCLEKLPHQRYQTCDELISEIKGLAGGSHLRTIRPPSGDVVIVDESERPRWPMTIRCQQERPSWIEGVAFRFENRFFRLGEIHAPDQTSSRWTYRFEPWPEAEIFRGVIDYEEDCQSRESTARSRLPGFVRKLIGGE